MKKPKINRGTISVPEIISEKVLYKSKLSEVIEAKVKLHTGKIVEWDYFGNCDVVAVLPVDTDGNVYLIKEWRPAWRQDVIQIPTGHCTYKTEPGRLKQVHNELQEEIGMDAKKLKKIVKFATYARMTKDLIKTD